MILVTGGSGQVARSLEALAGARPVKRVGRPAFDFDDNATVTSCLRETRPAMVINAAAWTAVDAAESNADAAARANRDGPELLARYCADAGIPLIHISTDYVFDGLKGAPYVESDPTNPTGVYGATKLAGEAAVLAACPSAVVLRTSWVFAPEGKNFVLTLLNAAKKTNKLRVVADQHGCPTGAPALAAAILEIADKLAADPSGPWAGVYHAAGTGGTTWHGLAVALFEEAARHGVTPPEIEPITTADWPTPARRPPDSRLDCGKLDATFGVKLPDWRVTLGKVVDAAFLR
jgi:dTDP-4-dehydrorhamnose reductase